MISRRRADALACLAERLMAWHHRRWSRSFGRLPALATRVVVCSLRSLAANIGNDRRKDFAGRPKDHVALNDGNRPRRVVLRLVMAIGGRSAPRLPHTCFRTEPVAAGRRRTGSV